MRSPQPVAAWLRRDHIVILACVAVMSALAWGYLLHIRGQMSVAMNMPWAPADVLFAFVMWSVMMVGMMTGSATPAVLLVASSQARRPNGRVTLATPLFGLGYLAVWLGFSACAALAQWAMHEAALLSSNNAISSVRFGGAILIAAGVYQWTPLKGACLTHCRSPLGFLLTHWRDGSLGALQMGLRHGVYCLGCCWALMAVLFAAGVMNLVWVAVLAAFVLLEKIGPGGRSLSRVGGAILIAAGVFFMVRPT